MSSGAEKGTTGRAGWLDLDVTPNTALVAALGLTVLLAVGDGVTGPYLVFATFYLAPVALASWYGSRNRGLVVSLVAALVGVVSTALDPQSVPTAIYVTNGLFRFITYAFVSIVVAAEHDAMRTIRALASVDPLTQLFNRRRFYELATAELARSARSGRSMALAVIDVDDLKQRNDTYGHEAGDAMLVEVADAMRRELRSTDVVARLGGDEFAILMPEVDRAEADGAVARVTGALERSEVLPIRLSVGMLVGVAPEDAEVEALVRQADERMYEAKHAGKGRLVTAELT